jgi:two-component system cell cycle sensor histidine kinase PleC
MLSRRNNKAADTSLLGEYSALVGDAVLRQRARSAEQDARVQSDLVNKIRSEFLSNMSHELRTPLNTVMGFSKMLGNHSASPLKAQEIVDYAGIIHDAARQLLSVINDILDMSKIQAGRYVLDHTETEVDEILRTCLIGHRLIAAQAGVMLNDDIAGNLHSITGDPVKLHQIFNNVLSNAIKFTPRDGTVTLTASNHRDSIVVVVRDDGIGMSAHDIAIALTPFGQVDGAHNRWREGTGLGLPIANSLVELHHGQLSIQSEPGKGTEIAIALPKAGRAVLAKARDALMEQPGL